MAAAVIVIVAGIVLIVDPVYGSTSFDGAFIVDEFARFLKILALDRLGAGDRHVVRPSRGRPASSASSIPILIVISTLGMMMMVSAGDLIALYLGLELHEPRRSTSSPRSAAIPSAPPRPASSTSCSARCRRACCSTASSLVYGFTGKTVFADIAAALSRGRRRRWGSSSASCSCSPASASRSRRCPSTCGRRTSTRARRRR
jgi:NADH-quinone oxidoreductase subunit N